MQLDAMASASREVVHVLYMDIVRYSLLAPEVQQAAYQKLQEIVCGTDAYRKALAASKLLSRPVGDGMALLFFDSVESSLHCALEIAEAMRGHSEFALRMGVHSGEVFVLQDINGIPDVAGEAINTAQRVMDCGEAGHILVSGAVAEPLEHADVWPSRLRYLGVCEVKHGKRLALWNLCSATAGNVRVPGIVVEWKTREAQEIDRVNYPHRWKPIQSKTAIVGLIYLLVMAVSFLPFALLFFLINLTGPWQFLGVIFTILYIGGLIAYLVYSSGKKENRQ